MSRSSPFKIERGKRNGRVERLKASVAKRRTRQLAWLAALQAQFAAVDALSKNKRKSR